MLTQPLEVQTRGIPQAPVLPPETPRKNHLLAKHAFDRVNDMRMGETVTPLKFDKHIYMIAGYYAMEHFNSTNVTEDEMQYCATVFSLTITDMCQRHVVKKIAKSCMAILIDDVINPKHKYAGLSVYGTKDRICVVLLLSLSPFHNGEWNGTAKDHYR